MSSDTVTIEGVALSLSGPQTPAFAAPASLVLVLIGAAMAGFGVGALALSLMEPDIEVTPLPSPSLARAAPAPGRPVPDQAAPAWAAAFGVEPVELPEPEPLPDEPLEIDEDEPETYEPENWYTLRGVVTDPDGGWALIESDDGTELVRVGDVMSGGEEVMSIADDGVTLQGFDGPYLLGFEEFEDRVDERPSPRMYPAMGVPRGLGSSDEADDWDDENWDDENWDDEDPYDEGDEEDWRDEDTRGEGMDLGR